MFLTNLFRGNESSYGQYYEHMYTTIFSDVVNPNVIRNSITNGGSIHYQWLGDLNNDGLVEPNEIGSVLSRFTPTANSIDPSFKDPKAHEFTLGYQREVTANLGLSASWIERKPTRACGLLRGSPSRFRSWWSSRQTRS